VLGLRFCCVVLVGLPRTLLLLPGPLAGKVVCIEKKNDNETNFNADNRIDFPNPNVIGTDPGEH
jgi:hypothetical protein